MPVVFEFQRARRDPLDKGTFESGFQKVELHCTLFADIWQMEMFDLSAGCSLTG